MSLKQKRIFWSALCLVIATTTAFALAVSRKGRLDVSKASGVNSPAASGSNVHTATKTVQATDRHNDDSATPANHATGSVVPDATAAVPIVEDDDKGFWLTLRATGFETKEMTITAGDYFVIVQNGTGLDQFGLRIVRGNGQRIHEMRLPRQRKHWRQMIRFTPGVYIVSEIDHPEWNCRITVTPPQ